MRHKLPWAGSECRLCVSWRWVSAACSWHKCTKNTTSPAWLLVFNHPHTQTTSSSLLRGIIVKQQHLLSSLLWGIAPPSHANSHNPLFILHNQVARLMQNLVCFYVPIFSQHSHKLNAPEWFWHQSQEIVFLTTTWLHFPGRDLPTVKGCIAALLLEKLGAA